VNHASGDGRRHVDHIAAVSRHLSRRVPQLRTGNDDRVRACHTGGEVRWSAPNVDVSSVARPDVWPRLFGTNEGVRPASGLHVKADLLCTRDNTNSKVSIHAILRCPQTVDAGSASGRRAHGKADNAAGTVAAERLNVNVVLQYPSPKEEYGLPRGLSQDQSPV
jgi:hypothetical protein